MDKNVQVKSLCNVAREALDKIAENNSSAMFSEYSWVNIEQVKTLCVVAQEVPDNIAYEKVIFKVVLILLGQNFIGQNSMQCCTRSSKQLFIRKSPVQCYLNTLETILYRSKPYAMLTEMLQTTLHKKNSCSMFS